MDSSQYAITWESVRDKDESFERGYHLVVGKIFKLG